MSGLRDFSTETAGFRNITVKTTAYTVTTTDEKVVCTPTASMVLTLFPLNSLQGTTQAKKIIVVQNTGTANVVITPGTDTVTNVANTINASKTTFVLKPNETVSLIGRDAATDWQLSSPYPIPALLRVPFAVCVTSNGTTAVNVWSADGAPANLWIDEVYANSQDAIAGNMTLYNASSTICTIAKVTTAGTITGATTLTFASVASGAGMTINGSGTGQARLTIIGTMQTYV